MGSGSGVGGQFPSVSEWCCRWKKAEKEEEEEEEEIRRSGISEGGAASLWGGWG